MSAGNIDSGIPVNLLSISVHCPVESNSILLPSDSVASYSTGFNKALSISNPSIFALGKILAANSSAGCGSLERSVEISPAQRYAQGNTAVIINAAILISHCLRYIFSLYCARF